MAVDFKKLLGEKYTDEIASVLGELESKLLVNDGTYIPKTRFDEVNSKLKGLETQFEAQRVESLTADEKLTQALKNAELKADEYLIKSNKLDVEKIFVAQGIKDYEGFIDDIVGKDKETSIKVAERIVASVKNAVATTSSELEKLKLINTPKPDISSKTTGTGDKLNWTELANLKASDPKAYETYIENNQ